MCIIDFFAGVGTGWINAATIVGAIAGVGLSIFAIWFSKQLNDESAIISDAIHKNTDAIREQTEAIAKHTKILRLDNLRNLYELSRDGEFHNHWHFRWRFETFDCLRGSVKSSDQKTILGHCELQIQGFSNRPDHISFEGREPEFYTAKVQKTQTSDGEEFPFDDGETVACFMQNGDVKVSRGTDPWTSNPSYDFTIAGIGRQEIRRGEVLAQSARVYPRIRDS